MERRLREQREADEAERDRENKRRASMAVGATPGGPVGAGSGRRIAPAGLAGSGDAGEPVAAGSGGRIAPACLAVSGDVGEPVADGSGDRIAPRIPCHQKVDRLATAMAFRAPRSHLRTATSSWLQTGRRL